MAKVDDLTVVEAQEATTKPSKSETVAVVTSRTREQVLGLPRFLENNELLFLSDKLQDEGFTCIEDVLELTPRKYDALGVDKLGTRLRLNRV